MKKLVAIAIGTMLGASVWAQGIIDFNNTVGLGSKIFESDGTTALAGSAYKVDMFYGAVGADPSTFTSLGIAADFSSGGFAGFFAGGQQSVPLFPAGSTITVQPRAWRASDGLTWAAAFANPAGGHVSSMTAPTVNVLLKNGAAVPAEVGLKLTGIVGHSLIVAPEPSTILLGLAGISGLLFLRRKMA